MGLAIYFVKYLSGVFKQICIAIHFFQNKKLVDLETLLAIGIANSLHMCRQLACSGGLLNYNIISAVGIVTPAYDTM